MKSIDICNEVAELSNSFEINNSELKRHYIIKNIMLYNYIVSKVNSNCGSFGTGYPFYALGQNLEGNLPIVEEQIRYNNELSEAVSSCMHTTWTCAECLAQKGHTMADLKHVCKPCPNMDDRLKPRKVINRMPDIDMWMVCKDNTSFESSMDLIKLFKEYQMSTSDVNPLQTIYDFKKIVEDLNNDTMPELLLPIDSHIVDYSTLYSLIEQVPEALEEAMETNTTPYLPIHPLSYRKTWQYDDSAYNFVHDYLSSFTPYNFEPELMGILTETRNLIANKYTIEQLYHYLIASGPESVLRRHRTKELKNRFYERVESWKR